MQASVFRDRGLLSETENKEPEAEQKRVEFSFPLLTVRTKVFSGVFDKLGSFGFSRYASWVALFIVPVVAAVGLVLFVGSLYALIMNPAIGEITRELGPTAFLLLPGINPIVPIFYGWLAIVCALVVHEGAHGVVARSAGFRVKSSGLLFFLIIPIGAFVDVDEDEIKKAKPRRSLRVMAAGVGANIAVAVVCLVGVMLVVGSLAPVVDGVFIGEVSEGNPAQAAGLRAKDVFVSIDGVLVNRTSDLSNILGNRTAGDVVEVTVLRGELWQDQFSTFVTLTILENRTVMGVSVGDLVVGDRLTNYQNFSLERLTIYLVPPTIAGGVVPFSDGLSGFYTSSLGAYWAVYANVLYWLWFINVNLAIFNALPLGPLDGGRMFSIALKGLLGKRLSEKKISLLISAVTIALIVLVVSVVVLPFILPYILPLFSG